MNRLLNIVIILLFCGLSAGCVGDQPASHVGLEGTTFTGVIPCADCEGIAYRLSLKAGHRFESSSVYIGKSNKPFIERGSWSSKADSLLVLNGVKEDARQFKIKHDQLIMLDRQGKEVSGSLAKMYVLNEADTTSSDQRWEKQRRGGIDFRATGNEPFWNMAIDFDKMMTFKSMYGDSIRIPVPQMQTDTSGKARVWNAETEFGSLKVKLYPTACRDDMSGRIFSHRVQVTYKNKSYTGCGNFINNRYKLNDFWMLRAIHGTKISPKNHPKIPMLIFDVFARHVSGNDGCNQLSGAIKLDGSSLSFSNMMTTKMACRGSMQLETHFLNALQKVDRYNIVNAELVLMNGQDTLMVFQRVM